MSNQPTQILATVVALLGSGAAYGQDAVPGIAEDASPAPALPPPATTQPATPPPYQPPASPPAGYYPPQGAYVPPPAPYAPPPGYYYPTQPPTYYQAAPTEPPGREPGDHTHDGFFLRLNPGIGILHAKYSYGGYDTTISGGGAALSFALGGAITPNLIIYGEVLSVQASNPTVDTGSGYGSSGLGGDIGLVGIGPGMAYYFESANLYLSGTLAFSRVTTSSNSSSVEYGGDGSLTDMGFGVALTVGKEWWVSQNWGLGVAGLLHVASMKMQSMDARMTAEGVSILFSATYN
jgi:hypothetical protein